MKKAATMRALILICYVLLILPHMNPQYFNLMPSANFLLNIIRLFSFYILSIRLFIVRHKISAPTLIIFCLELYLLLMTVFQHGDTYNHLADVFSIISIAFLYDCLEGDPKIFLSSLLFCFEIVIYVNFITILLYPDGMYDTLSSLTLFKSHKNYFLGYYNNLDQYFTPALVTAWLYTELTGKRLRTFVMMAVVYASALLIWSGGILLALFAMLVPYLYIIIYGKTPRFINYITCWLIHPLFLLGIVVLKLHTYFRWLIDGILRKGRSFFLRTELWDKMLSLIAERPILGHGILSSLDREREAGFYFAMHAHNLPLEIAYRGGLICLVLFIALVIVSGKRLYARRDTKVAQIITLGFLGWCVHTTVEPYMTSFLMGLFILAYKCDLFISAAEARRENSGYETPRQIGVYRTRNLY